VAFSEEERLRSEEGSRGGSRTRKAKSARPRGRQVRKQTRRVKGAPRSGEPEEEEGGARLRGDLLGFSLNLLSLSSI